MNFHEQQESRRWQSALLLVAFVCVQLGMGALIHVVFAVISMSLGQGGTLAQPSTSALVMIGIVWFAMIAGSIFRWIDVKAGGAALAKRFGADQVTHSVRHENEKQLMNVVAEVSIASGTSQPEVYVLRSERSINAFVLGQDSKPVIVVTEGALSAFNREQLQAVVAHEFAHITNGDLPLNMRLLIALGGLLAIDEVGRLLQAKSATDSLHPGTIVGGVFIAIGTVGVVAGRLISAAFSRQREYLADATAVQFTRYPFALASALDLIREHESTTHLHGVHAQELAHLCFHSGKVKRWLRGFLSTHPSIDRRITAVDPRFKIKQRKQDKAQTEANHSAVVSHMPMMAAHTVTDKGALGTIDHVRGAPIPLVEPELSDRIVLLLSDDASCMATLFALFANDDEKKRREYLSALGFSFGDIFVGHVKKVMKLVPDELANDQLGLIVHVSKAINSKLNLDQRQKIALKLEKLLHLNGRCDLMDYARLQLVRRTLGLGFPVIEKIAGGEKSQANAGKVKSFEAMGREFALLLSVMVESSGAPVEELDEQFQSVLRCYTRENFPRRSANESGIVQEVEAAFQTLYVQPQAIRHAFVQHCIEIMRQDGHIAVSERALLDLFAASLGCDELIAA